MYRAGNEFSSPKEREAYLKNVVSTQLQRGLAHGLKAFTSLVHKKLYSNGGGIQALDAYSRDEISRVQANVLKVGSGPNYGWIGGPVGGWCASGGLMASSSGLLN